MTSGSRERGFTYLLALVAVAVVAAGAASFAEAWSRADQRRKEIELRWIGNQFRQAIALYYHRSSGAQRYPATLDDLLEDRRFPTPQRYLRRIYPDPITGKQDWQLIPAPSGGIMGVKSSSSARSVRTSLGETYADWQFVYEPPR